MIKLRAAGLQPDVRRAKSSGLAMLWEKAMKTSSRET